MEINKPISIIIILIVILILIFLFVIPKYQESDSLGLKLLQMQAEYSGKSAYYQKVDGLIAHLENESGTLQKVSSALPSNFSMAPLISFFQEKGIESGLAVKLMVFSEISAGSPADVAIGSSLQGVRNVTFTLNLSGSYTGLKTFLYSLERSARLFEVDSISFSSAELAGVQSNIEKTYEFELIVRTHTY